MGGAREPEGRRNLLVEGLSSIGGAAALALGVLYLAGIVLKTVELKQADLSVPDTLKLFPLEHILRSGLTLVVPALVTLAVMAAFVYGNLRFERWLATLTVTFREMEAPFQPEEKRQEWLKRLSEAEKRTAWGPFEKAVRRAMWAAWRSGDKARRKRLGPLWWGIIGWNVISLLASIFIFGFCVLLPPEFAIPTAILLLLMFAAGARPVEQQAAYACCVIVVALIASGLVFPRPLAKVSLVTDNAGALSGNLVLTADSTWYVGEADGVIRAVSDDHVECVQIVAQARRSTLLDHLRSQPGRSADKLKCKPMREPEAKDAGTPRPSAGPG
jgi:hypothetical protein